MFRNDELVDEDEEEEEDDDDDDEDELNELPLAGKCGLNRPLEVVIVDEVEDDDGLLL